MVKFQITMEVPNVEHSHENFICRNELFSTALVSKEGVSLYNEAQVASATYIHDIEDGLLR